MHLFKMLFVGLGAVCIMAAAVGTASANRLSISHSSLGRFLFNPIEFRGGFGVVRCPLTLEGSFHSSTMSKTAPMLIGYVTGATVRSCSAGGMTILIESLPWHVQYTGFLGVLPRFSGMIVNIFGFSLRISESVFGISCLSRSTSTNPARFIAEEITYEAGGNGIVNTFVAESGASIPCGSFSGRFEGTGRVTESPGGLANVLIRLI